MKDEKASGKRIIAVAGIIGSLTAILLGMIAARDYFPTLLVQVVVVLLLVMIIFVYIYEIFGERLKASVRRIRKARNDRELAKKHFKRFNRFVDKLGELLEPRRCDNIPYALNRIQSREPVFSDILLFPVDDFRDLFVVFRDGIGKLRRDKEMFLFLIKWFESLLNTYNRLCICKPVERTRNILRRHVAEIPEDIKDEYRQHKVAYDKFILEYMDFAKGINKDFGENVARDWFDMPKGLEL